MKGQLIGKRSPSPLVVVSLVGLVASLVVLTPVERAEAADPVIETITDPSQGAGFSNDHAIDDSGDRVVYFSTPNPGDNSATAWVEDISTGNRQILTDSLPGSVSEGITSFDTAISGDGNAVALLFDPQWLCFDPCLILYQATNGTFSPGNYQQINVGLPGAVSFGEQEPTLNEDGTLVAFQASWRPDLQSPAKTDVFLRNTAAGTTDMISVSSSGAQNSAASPLSATPEIAGNGRYVAFESNAPNFDPSDPDTETDIFVRDLQSNTTVRISAPGPGGSDSGISFEPTISDDGRFVSFISNADLTGASGSDTDIFIVDRGAPDGNGDFNPANLDIWLVTNNSTFEDSFGPSLSGSGQTLTYVDPTGANDEIVVYDVAARQEIHRLPTPNGFAYQLAIDGTGTSISFSDLFSGDSGTASDVYVYNLDVQPDDEGLTVTSLPLSEDSVAGSGWILQVHYEDPMTGDPVPGVAVNIEVVDGPHTSLSALQGCDTGLGLGSCITDANGNATWYLLGNVDAVGVDDVRIFVDGGPTSFISEVNGALDLGEPVVFATRNWLEPVQYVGLGDSYSSGEGAGAYEPGTDEPDVNECHRSFNAYSHWIQTPGYPIPNELYSLLIAGEWDFIACSGARTFHVYDVDAPGLPVSRAQTGEPDSQLGQPPTDSDVTMVVLTIGGNDLGFEPILTKCGLPTCTDPSTEIAGVPLMDYVAAQLGVVADRLDHTYSQIRSDMENATVFVLGYPQIFPDPGASCGGSTTFDPDEQALLRDIGTDLEAVISSATANAGFHYVSVVDHFEGHEVCGEDGEWIRGLVPAFTFPPVSVESFHPNARGQLEYWRVLDDYIEDQLAAGAPQLPNGLPAAPGGPFASSAYRVVLASSHTSSTPELGRLDVEPTVAWPANSCLGRVEPGAEVDASGDGFEPDSSVDVSVYVDETTVVSLGTFVADSDGRLAATVLLPATNSETVLFEALGTDSTGVPRLLLGWVGTGDPDIPCPPTPVPTIDISTPASGAVYSVGQSVVAEFNCQMDGQPVECVAYLQSGDNVSTETPGSYQLRVTALGPNGEMASAVAEYTVADPGTGECTIVGTPGDDVLLGTPGNDVICGEGGNDIIDAGGGDDLVYAGDGADEVQGGLGDDVIFGGPGDDDLRGNEGNDVIFGEDGDDYLGGGMDDDEIYGGNGSDTVEGKRGSDLIFGGPGDDDLRGNEDDDVIHGGEGNDVLGGGQGDDQLFGEEGDDELDGKAGVDSGDGGPGIDSCQVESAINCE